jgi:hypothetical protein
MAQKQRAHALYEVGGAGLICYSLFVGQQEIHKFDFTPSAWVAGFCMYHQQSVSWLTELGGVGECGVYGWGGELLYDDDEVTAQKQRAHALYEVGGVGGVGGWAGWAGWP